MSSVNLRHSVRAVLLNESDPARDKATGVNRVENDGDVRGLRCGSTAVDAHQPPWPTHSGLLAGLRMSVMRIAA